MPLEIIRNDITKVHADAIVNAASSSLLSDGGVSAAIHLAAGTELLQECRALGGCEVGEAQITRGYKLNAKYVIHTVGPIWRGGGRNEGQLLADCYNNSLALAKDYHLESIAFPLISSGAFRFPKDQALQIAISVIGNFLLHHEMTVILVVYDRASYELSEKLASSISQYIDEHYIEEQPIHTRASLELERNEQIRDSLDSYDEESEFFSESAPASFKKYKRSLVDLVQQLDETFSQTLLRLIDEKGITDAEAYKKANIDRKLFSKIRNDIYYKPSKSTVIAFAIALELNLDGARNLLLKAGYALSHSSKFDVIIEYFIMEGNYNIFEINEALFAFDQNLLGS